MYGIENGDGNGRPEKKGEKGQNMGAGIGGIGLPPGDGYLAVFYGGSQHGKLRVLREEDIRDGILVGPAGECPCPPDGKLSHFGVPTGVKTYPLEADRYVSRVVILAACLVMAPEGMPQPVSADMRKFLLTRAPAEFEVLSGSGRAWIQNGLDDNPSDDAIETKEGEP